MRVPEAMASVEQEQFQNSARSVIQRRQTMACRPWRGAVAAKEPPEWYPTRLRLAESSQLRIRPANSMQTVHAAVKANAL